MSIKIYNVTQHSLMTDDEINSAEFSDTISLVGPSSEDSKMITVDLTEEVLAHEAYNQKLNHAMDIAKSTADQPEKKSEAKPDRWLRFCLAFFCFPMYLLSVMCGRDFKKEYMELRQ